MTYRERKAINLNLNLNVLFGPINPVKAGPLPPNVNTAQNASIKEKQYGSKKWKQEI
jgi:hypothetical protein